jgi:cytochrome bd-type quinol oxidase subunit 2
MKYPYYCIYQVMQKHPHLGAANWNTVIVLTVLSWSCLFLLSFFLDRATGQETNYASLARNSAIPTMLGIMSILFIYYERMNGRQRTLKAFEGVTPSKQCLAIGYVLALFPVIAPFAIAAILIWQSKI